MVNNEIQLIQLIFLPIDEQDDICYLYQHIHFSRQDRAIEWISKYLSKHLDQNVIKTEEVVYMAIK